MNELHPPAPEPSDETLAARVAQRDVTAFALLYDRYAQSVFALAAHLLGRAEAEEAVQEIFLRLWNKAAHFDHARGAFSAWFMTIARHYVLDQLRVRSLQQRLIVAEQVDQLLANAADPRVDVEHAAYLRERGDALLRALQQLPSEQRRVLALAYFGGLSQSEIARHLNLPLGTVKKRTQLGLQKLRALLADQGLQVDPSISARSKNE